MKTLVFSYLLATLAVVGPAADDHGRARLSDWLAAMLLRGSSLGDPEPGADRPTSDKTKAPPG